jgi:hypothetical protein
MKKLNRIIARALEKAAVSETELSEEAGYHATSFSRFKQGVRDATPAAACALANALRKRAQSLLRLADELESAAGPEKER